MSNDVRLLDEVDRTIVRTLQRDGRTSNQALAQEAGIAASTCVVRLRSLRERGVLRGIHADVDPAALGLSLQAMIAVSLRPDRRAAVGDFAAEVPSGPTSSTPSTSPAATTTSCTWPPPTARRSARSSTT